MAKLVWTEHPHSRQATKTDLLDIARALCGPDLSVDHRSSVAELRGYIRTTLEILVGSSDDLGAKVAQQSRQLMLAHHELGDHSMCEGDCTRDVLSNLSERDEAELSCP